MGTAEPAIFVGTARSKISAVLRQAEYSFAARTASQARQAKLRMAAQSPIHSSAAGGSSTQKDGTTTNASTMKAVIAGSIRRVNRASALLIRPVCCRRAHTSASIADIAV